MPNEAIWALTALLHIIGSLVVPFPLLSFVLFVRWLGDEIDDANVRFPWLAWWFLLVPVGGMWLLIWLVPRLTQTLRNEYRQRGHDASDENLGTMAGLLWGGSSVVLWGLIVVQHVLHAHDERDWAVRVWEWQWAAIIVGLGSWVAYWIQLNRQRRRLSGERSYEANSPHADYDEWR